MVELDHTTIQAICGNWLVNRLETGSLVAVELDDDVVGVDTKNRVTAIEVKVSWSDFLREWKKDKHGLRGWQTRSSSLDHQRWYFAAPEDLAPRIKQWLQERKTPYGCLSVAPPRQGYRTQPSKWVTVIRKARYQQGLTKLLKSAGFKLYDYDENYWYTPAREQIARRCMWDALNQRCHRAGIFMRSEGM